MVSSESCVVDEGSHAETQRANTKVTSRFSKLGALCVKY